MNRRDRKEWRVKCRTRGEYLSMYVLYTRTDLVWNNLGATLYLCWWLPSTWHQIVVKPTFLPTETWHPSLSITSHPSSKRVEWFPIWHLYDIYNNVPFSDPLQERKSMSVFHLKQKRSWTMMTDGRLLLTQEPDDHHSKDLTRSRSKFEDRPRNLSE